MTNSNQGLLFSIGHGTRKIEDFLALLQKYHIAYLIDVRTLPFSRFNPQYNQRALKQSVEEHQVRYVFMGDTLGGRPKDLDCYDDKGKVNYSILRQKDYFLNGIDRLKTAYAREVAAAVMCSERKPQDCHRSLLIGKVLAEQEIIVRHIDETGELKDQDTLEKEFRMR